MKTCILIDHDGVLVDTEHWNLRAGRRALADIGLAIGAKARHRIETLMELKDSAPGCDVTSRAALAWRIRGRAVAPRWR